jgi:DNA adenine methylase
VIAPTRPVLRYHGGKWRIAPWIIGHFPEHRVYIEPYGGAGSVLMRKPRSEFEIYNDLDADVVNVFRVLRDSAMSTELARVVELTPWSRREFIESYEPTADMVERARRTIVRCFMSHGSTSRRRHASGFRGKWHPDRRGGGAGDWPGYPALLSVFTERLQRVVIEERPAQYVVERYDGPGVLFYADPPYPLSTRSSMRSERDSGRAYQQDMTDDDHRRLAAALHRCEGAVVLSGYPSELYDDELYVGWTRSARRAMADHGQERTEVLWMKPFGPMAHVCLSLEQASLDFAVGGP